MGRITFEEFVQEQNTNELLNKLLDELEAAGVLSDVVHGNNKYQFCFKNQFVKDCLWDGEITYPWGADVLNEIDVLTLQGNIPTFISCKSGKMEGAKALPALYELETVARRFGGKYAKKVLVVTRELGDAYQARADEMGIKVCEK